MKHKIYAYYEAIQSLPQDEEFSCANYWKQSWEKNGWECVMLNKSHAVASAVHQKLMQKLVKLSFALPMELQSKFPMIVARFSRWSALHAAGGGWMSDYDVFNYSLTPDIANQSAKTLNLIAGEPCHLFYATREHCAAAITKFINEELVEGSSLRFESDILNLTENLNHFSDKIHHAKKGDKPKSEVMAALLQ